MLLPLALTAEWIFFPPPECNGSKCNLDSRHCNKYKFERQGHFFGDYLVYASVIALTMFSYLAYMAVFFTSSLMAGVLNFVSPAPEQVLALSRCSESVC